jgi:hypothetical protein
LLLLSPGGSIPAFSFDREHATFEHHGKNVFDDLWSNERGRSLSREIGERSI